MISKYHFNRRELIHDIELSILEKNSKTSFKQKLLPILKKFIDKHSENIKNIYMENKDGVGSGELRSKMIDAVILSAFDAINNHPEMILSAKDFAAYRINWLPKLGNIKDIANELGVDIDSVCFVDDNPIERAEVRYSSPEIFIPELPDEISEWKELFSELGDNQMLLQSLKDSPYYKAFQDTGSQFEKKFALLDEVFHTLNLIQRKWVYLEPIFGRGALPSEQSRFNRVDEEFREIVIRLEGEPTVFNLADDTIFPRLSESTKTMLAQLERCSKGE